MQKEPTTAYDQAKTTYEGVKSPRRKVLQQGIAFTAAIVGVGLLFTQPTLANKSRSTISFTARLYAPAQLNQNDYVRSYNGTFALLMQTDGNLVLYILKNNRFYRATWASNTAGNPGAYCLLQSDGNLVVYNANGAAIWASNTVGYQSVNLYVQDDGNMVIYTRSGYKIWETVTGSGQ